MQQLSCYITEHSGFGWALGPQVQGKGLKKPRELSSVSSLSFLHYLLVRTCQLFGATAVNTQPPGSAPRGRQVTGGWDTTKEAPGPEEHGWGTGPGPGGCSLSRREPWPFLSLPAPQAAAEAQRAR